jgi:6-hydroxytryprostatin B O-methyltransferase
MPGNNLQDLTVEIVSATKTISEFCDRNGYALPALKINPNDLTQDVLPKTAPVEIEAARQMLLDSSMRIQQIISEPSQYLPQLAVWVR